MNNSIQEKIAKVQTPHPTPTKNPVLHIVLEKDLSQWDDQTLENKFEARRSRFEPIRQKPVFKIRAKGGQAIWRINFRLCFGTGSVKFKFP